MSSKEVMSSDTSENTGDASWENIDQQAGDPENESIE